MKGNKNRFAGLRVWLSLLILVLAGSTTVMAQKTIKLSDEQVDNLVKRSYQYVAVFNVNQKYALEPASGDLFTDGFNKPVAATTLADHTMKAIARTNNDTLYQVSILDLRNEPVIIEFPAIDSKFACLETSGYDHQPPHTPESQAMITALAHSGKSVFLALDSTKNKKWRN